MAQISDNVRMQAAMAAKGAKDAVKVDALPSTDIPTAELGTGSAGHPTFIHGNYSQAIEATAPTPEPVQPEPEPGT